MSRKQKTIRIICIVVIFLSLLVWHWRTSHAMTRFSNSSSVTTGSCFRNEEFGVIYRVENIGKGYMAEVVASEKYPSSDTYKIGARAHWPSDKLSNSKNVLEATSCP